MWRRIFRAVASDARCCWRCSVVWSRLAITPRSSGCCAAIPRVSSTSVWAARPRRIAESPCAASRFRRSPMAGTICRRPCAAAAARSGRWRMTAADRSDPLVAMAELWEKSYPAGVSWNAPLPEPVAIETLLVRAAERWGSRVACDFYGWTLSFADWLALARRAAKGFRALGVGPGVSVGLHLPNTPHYLIAFFGILIAGGRVVNFSPLYAVRELRHQLEDSDTEVMVTLDLPQLYPQIAALKGAGNLGTVVVASLTDFLPEAAVRAILGPPAERKPGPGREIDFKELIANDGAIEPPARGPLAREIAVLQYTGGTTGEP